MKKILFVFVIALMLLPMAVFGQCGTQTVTEAGNVYQTLKIGPHCWLKPNLKTNVPGSLIYYSDMYPDTIANLNTYGRLYLWETAVKAPVVADGNGFVQGICPNGWHIPNEAEVVELTSNVAPAVHATTNWLIPGTNTTDYTQLPGGFYNAITNRYENLCGEAYFWSIGSDQKPVEVWSDCHCDMFLLNPGKVQNGLSVRCVYDIYKAKVSTVDASNVTKSSAQLNGEVIFSGYDQSFERGFQWGTEMNDLSNILVEGTNVSSEGTYNVELTELNAGTPYYYRTYVVNDFDTAFGVVRSFITKFDKIVSTDSANTIKAKSAILYGTVLTELENIKERGFCYGLSNDPNFDDYVFSETNFPSVSFQTEVVNLEANTSYFYNAYAITQYDDTLYGSAKEFTTLPPMSAKTDSVNSITKESAVLYGNVIGLGGNESVNAGFKYGTSETALDSIVGKEDIGGTGLYSCPIQNLEASSMYYYAAYVTTGANDTVWSDTLSFKTLSINSCPKTPTVSDEDGNVYNTIQIGKQCWMAENLRTKVEGDLGYPQVSNVVVEDAIKAGRLYSWVLATGDTSSARVPSGIQGICPDGWHVPSDAEWTALTNYVHNQSEYKCPGCAEVQDASLVCCIASSLSSKTGWADVADGCSLGNSSTNNATGFDAFPAGRLDENHNHFRICAYFWSSTQGDDTRAFTRYMRYDDSDVHEELVPKEQGLSVRCLRDPMSVTTDSANSITKESAILYGNVKNLGLNESVNAGFKYGVCKTALDSIVIKNDVESVGEYHMNITGLYPNSDYFFVAFIAYETDTVYGDTMSLTTKTMPCPGIKHENEGGVDNAIISVKDIDNNEYTVIQIGKQCWMAENLRTKVEGDLGYPQVSDVVVEDSIKAGRLYSWVLATGDTSSASVPSGIQGICPDGWHVPSDAEWTILTDYVSSKSEYKCQDCDDTPEEFYVRCIASSLASTNGWHDEADGCALGNSSSNNATGFNAFPAGRHTENYEFFSEYAFFWSSTQLNENHVFCRHIFNADPDVHGDAFTIEHGLSVRCLRDPMSVTTDSANSITKESAILYGNVKNLGEYLSVSAGFKYGVSRTAMDSIVVVESVDETGLYSCPISNLEAATIYFYKAFVAAGTDTAWGEVKNLRTLTINPCENAPTLEDVEGNVYNTIQIGEQCWMAENLRTTKKPDGSPITSATQIWYCPNNCSLTSDTVMTYGLLYNWDATTQGVSSVSNPMVGGICPEGWHVPSDVEWTTLIQYVKEQPEYQCEDSRKIAKSLASKQGWKNNTTPCAVGNNPSENNKTGFNAFPAGNYDNNNSRFPNFSERAYFWSSTVFDNGNDMYRGLRFGLDTVVRDHNRKYDGLSVRCLRNTEIPVSDMSVQTDSVNAITNASAVLYGYVADLGGNTPVKAGFKYGVNRMALDSNVVAEGIESAGEYHLNITGLHPNSEYFFVAYVAYEDEIAYGDTLRFTAATVPCVGTKQDNEGGADNAIVSVKDGDDNEYRVVKIGNQCWMAENLRTKVDGDKGYPQVNGVVVADSIKAGRLYGWEKVTGGENSETIPSGIQGICPEGWHVPSDTEWTVLANYVKEQVDCQCGNSNEKIARSLASETGWDVNNTPCNVGYQNGGTNVTGFNAFPAGYYANNQVQYNNFGSRVYFWSATKFDNNNAKYRGIRNDRDSLDSDINSIYNALSVRCVRQMPAN